MCEIFEGVKIPVKNESSRWPPIFHQGEQSNVENEVQDISFELQFNKHWNS